MMTSIERLCEISKKQERVILGLMSGTSLDGLDMALCRFNGHGQNTSVKVVHFCTADYDDAFKQLVREVFSRRNADLEQVCILNEYIGLHHAELINRALADWEVPREEVDLIASHGQTIYHAPKGLHGMESMPNSTLQIGDPDHIAFHTGIITIGDFRQKHLAAGGEGAPLAGYGDYLLFSVVTENRVLLNIGGISNFSFIPSAGSRPIFSTDTGPGNTMMDSFVRKHYPGLAYDKDSALASKGSVIDPLLQELLNDPFFGLPFPKTTGPELFNDSYLESALEQSGRQSSRKEDILATLNMFSATCIADGLRSCLGEEDYTVYVSGGGMHNQLLLENIRRILPGAVIKTTDDLGVQPDAKEAVLFATLANECVAGVGPAYPGGMPSVRMGKICLPD